MPVSFRNGSSLYPDVTMIPNFDLTIKGTGQVIERLRLTRTPSLTQEQLAERVGCNKSDISRYEKNQSGIPFSRLVLIAKVFDLTPNDLLQECIAFASEHGIPLKAYDRIKAAGEGA